MFVQISGICFNQNIGDAKEIEAFMES